MIHNVAGWSFLPLGQPPDQVGDFRRQTYRAVEVGLRGINRPGVGYVEDILRLGDVGGHVAGIRQLIGESARGVGLPHHRERAQAIGGRLCAGIFNPLLPLDRVRQRARVVTCGGRYRT